MAEAWGTFQLLERVSESEATENFRAQNEKGELVWLKRARNELLKDDGFAPLMLADLTAAAALSHPAVLSMLAHGEVDGVPYLVQPMLAGWTLDELIHQARGTPLLPVGAARAAALLKPVLEALAAAHAMTPSLLHRDLSPENVMVSEDGRVLLANFGLARARLRAGSSKGLSRAYVSVEQARGQPLDARSEVFAAGLLLFELTCGRLPAEGSAGDVISRIASYDLEAATSVNPNVDRAIAALLSKALAQSPDERFQTAQAFLDALTPLVPADATALVGQWAALIDEEVPTRPIKTQPKPATAGTTATPPATGSAPAAIAATAAPKARRKLPLRNLSLGAVALAAVVGAALRVSQHPVVDLHQDWPETVIASTPTSSEVILDGQLLKEKTPVSLHLEPNSVHEIFVRHNSMHSQQWRIQNTKRLEVDLVSGEIHDDRGAQSPPVPAPPAPPAPRTPASSSMRATVEDTPEPAHSYVAVDFPIEVELDEHFALWVDNQATRDVEKGDRLEQQNGISLFNRLAFGVGRGNYSEFDVFAAWAEGEKLRLQDLREPLIADAARPLYLFAVSREGGGHTAAVVKHQDQPVRIDALRVPQTRNLLEVSRLDPLANYCFSLQPTQGALPPVLGAYTDRQLPLSTDDNGDDLEPELDGKLELGPSLVGPGNHVLRHTASAWFTVPALEGTKFVPVKLRFGLCAADKKKPAPKKKKKKPAVIIDE